MTINITLMMISDSEIRLTLDGDIRISGNVSSLLFSLDAHGPAMNSIGEGSDTARQELLTVEQTAEVLHVSRDRVSSLIRSGELRSVKIGRLRRIHRQVVTEFIAQSRS